MRLISHRGNINGKQPDLENEPKYINDALKQGYDVEIDLWFVDGFFWLGHDEPQYEVAFKWLTRRSHMIRERVGSPRHRRRKRRSSTCLPSLSGPSTTTRKPRMAWRGAIATYPAFARARARRWLARRQGSPRAPR